MCLGLPEARDNLHPPPHHCPKGNTVFSKHCLRRHQGAFGGNRALESMGHLGPENTGKLLPGGCLSKLPSPELPPLIVAYCFQHIFPMASFSLIIEAKLDSNGFAQKRASSASSFREQEAPGASRGPSAGPGLF